MNTQQYDPSLSTSNFNNPSQPPINSNRPQFPSSILNSQPSPSFNNSQTNTTSSFASSNMNTSQTPSYSSNFVSPVRNNNSTFVDSARTNNPNSNLPYFAPPNSQTQPLGIQLQNDPSLNYSSYNSPISAQYTLNNENSANYEVKLRLSKPKWDTKKEGPQCLKCGSKFTLFLRRHHCRCCEREFCDPCSQKRISVPMFGHASPVRVCDGCFRHLSAGNNECACKLVPYFETIGSDTETALKEFAEIVQKQNIFGVESLIIDLFNETNCTQPLISVLQQQPNNESTTQIVLEILVSVKEEKFLLKLDQLGILPILIDILNSATCSELTKTYGLNLIYSLSLLKVPRQKFVELGGIKIIVEGLGSEDSIILELSVKIFEQLTLTPEIGISLGEHLPSVIILLSSENKTVVEKVIKIFQNLSKIEEMKPILLSIGVVSAFLFHYQSNKENLSAPLQVSCFQVIQELSKQPSGAKEITSLENGLSILLSSLDSSNEAIPEISLNIFQNLVRSESNIVVSQFLISTGLEKLFQKLNTPKTLVQRLCLEILSDLVMNYPAETNPLIRQIEGVEKLIAIINSQNDNMPQALNFLHKLIDQDVETTSIVIEKGGIPLLLEILHTISTNEVLALSILNSLISICQASPNAIENLSTQGGIQLEILHKFISQSSNPMLLDKSLSLLLLLSSHKAIKSKISSEFVQTLSKLVHHDTVKTQLCVLKIINALITSENLEEPLRDKFGETNCFVGLIPILQSGLPEIQEVAAVTLQQLARSWLNRERMKINEEFIHTLVSLISSNSTFALQQDSSKALIIEIICAISSDESSHPLFRSAHIFEILMEHLFNENELIIQNSILCLANLIRTDADCEVVQRQGGVLALINHLHSKNPFILEGAISTIGNLSRSASCKKDLIEGNVINFLIPYLQTSAEETNSQNSNLKIKIIWVLSLLSTYENFSSSIEASNLFISCLVNAMLQYSKDTNIIQQLAFTLMNYCANNSAHWENLVTLGGIPILMILIQVPLIDAQFQAANDLESLCNIEECRKQIIDSKDIPFFFTLLSHNETKLQNKAISILSSLSFDANSWSFILPSLKTLLPFFQSPQHQIEVLNLLSNLSQSEANWKELNQIDILLKVVEIIANNPTEDSLIIPSLNIICNMGKSESNAEIIHNQGGILYLIGLLTSKDLIQEKTVLALGNLANVCAKCRDSIFSNRGLDPVVSLLNTSTNLQVLANVIYLMSMLSSHSDFCETIAKQGGLPTLIHLIEPNSNLVLDLQQQILCILKNVSSNGSHQRTALIQAKVLSSLYPYLFLNSVPHLQSLAWESISYLSIEEQVKIESDELINSIPKYIEDDNSKIKIYVLKTVIQLSINGNFNLHKMFF